MEEKLYKGTIGFLWSIIDIVATTILFGNRRTIQEQFTTENLHITKCRFDLWLLGIIRGIMLFCCTIHIIRKVHSFTKRIKPRHVVAITFAILILDYNLVKLLVVSEERDRLLDVWYWLQFAWCCVGSIMFCVVYFLLINEASAHFEKENVNYQHEENIPLSQEHDSESKKEKTPKKEGTNKAKPITLFRLLALSKPDICYIVAGFIFLMLAAVGEIFIPFFTGLVVDGIVIHKSKDEVIKAISLMGVISFGSALATGIRAGAFCAAAGRLNVRIRNSLFSSIVNQEIGFFDNVKTGDITSRLTSDTTTMSETVTLNINMFLRNTIQAIGIVIFMFKLSWRLSLVTVIGLPIVLGVSKVYGAYYKKLQKNIQDSLAKANEVAEETCSSMKTVRSFANEDFEIRRYKKEMEKTYKLYMKRGLVYAGYAICNKAFELSLTIVVLYYGGHLAVNNMLSGGYLVAYILYQMKLGTCIETMGDVYSGLMQAAGASEKVFEYMKRKPLIKNDGRCKETIKGRIEFKSVTFSYPTRPDIAILKDVSFTICPGEVVALVGPSGSGKSSCINLIEHFYDVNSGLILLDNFPIQSYDHKYFHQEVALVGQEPILYATTIAKNILYGLPTEIYGENEIQEAARNANAHAFIEDMPDRYNTQAGEKGLQMSGGQKQRVAIARALIRKPTVLLLDEATSALDTESEHVIHEALFQNRGHRTVIIIAHRLSTVERADRILVIEKGQIVEQGTRSQLLKRNGPLARQINRHHQ